MSEDASDIRFKVFQPDNLIGVTEKRLMKLLAMEMELIAAREVVEAARFVLEEADPRYTEDFTPSQEKLSESLNKYDEARQK